METPPGFVEAFLKAAFIGDFPLLYGLAAAFENGEGPGKVSYANLKADDGATALHAAAVAGNTSICRFLIEKLNFDINPITNSAKFYFTSAGSIECVELLLKFGADPNGEYWLIRPLSFAKTEEMIRCLLNAGADPNKTDVTCRKALENAAIRGLRKGVEVLFPVTSRISYYPDWSINGIMQYEQSREALELRTSQMKKLFLLAKTKGKETFQRKDYWEALHWYTHAIVASGNTDAAVLSNRSFCWILLNDGDLALEDAQACVRLEPSWAKAHYREGAAFKVLKRYHEASGAFSRAMALDPGNQEIESAYRDVLAEVNKSSH